MNLAVPSYKNERCVVADRCQLCRLDETPAAIPYWPVRWR